MAKIDFYALCRYKTRFADRECWRCGYLKKQGYDVPNDLGIRLGVYKSIQKGCFGLKDETVWHVTDIESGLEIANGSSKKKAVEAAIERLKNISPEKIHEARSMVKKQYGTMPGSEGTFLWGKTNKDFYKESLNKQE